MAVSYQATDCAHTVPHNAGMRFRPSCICGERIAQTNPARQKKKHMCARTIKCAAYATGKSSRQAEVLGIFQHYYVWALGFVCAWFSVSLPLVCLVFSLERESRFVSEKYVSANICVRVCERLCVCVYPRACVCLRSCAIKARAA